MVFRKCEIEKKKRKITQKKNKRKKRKSEHKSKSHVRPADRSVLFCPVHTTCVRKELWREASRLITAHFQKPIPVKQKRGKESENCVLCCCHLPITARAEAELTELFTLHTHAHKQAVCNTCLHVDVIKHCKTKKKRRLAFLIEMQLLRISN